MRFDILTLFPAIFPGYLGESLLEKGIRRRLVEVHVHDLRNWSRDKHHKVDDRPFGGGPGMVLRVEPVVEGVEEIRGRTRDPGRLILLTPQGKRFDQRYVRELATSNRLILVCGRYEGFDQRIIDILKPEELSIGDFVLNGGEVAAMVVIDAVIRLIPGVLGDETSSIDDSFSREEDWIEFPQYTRPRTYRDHGVPDVLLNGNHEEIAEWRRAHAARRTERLREAE